MTVTIMEKKQKIKTRVVIFKNMGGNIPGGNFRVGIFQGGVWWVGIFRVGVFLIAKETCDYPAFEKTEFMRNILFSVHLNIQIRMQTFLEISQNFYND